MGQAKTWRERQQKKQRRELVASIILGAVCLCMVVAAVAAGCWQVNRAHAARNLGGANADHR